jgi:hypothetical protein
MNRMATGRFGPISLREGRRERGAKMTIDNTLIELVKQKVKQLDKEEPEGSYPFALGSTVFSLLEEYYVYQEAGAGKRLKELCVELLAHLYRIWREVRY